MSDDTISRKALLEALPVKWESAIEAIKNAPAVEAEPKWIPVTERLPDYDDMFIVCCDDSGCPMDEGIWYQSGVVVCAEHYKGSWTWYEGSHEWSLDGIVTHWMPLPEPPKGE